MFTSDIIFGNVFFFLETGCNKKNRCMRRQIKLRKKYDNHSYSFRLSSAHFNLSVYSLLREGI